MSIMRWLFLCGLCYSGSVLSAVSCNSIFPGPAQSFSAYSSGKSKSLDPGTLYMQSGAAINNFAGNSLCFENVKGYDSEMGNAACANGSSKCNITGVRSSVLTAPSFPTNSDSNNSYTIANWGFKNPVLGTTSSLGKYNTATGNWDVGPLTINDDSSDGSLYFSNNYKTYVISSITFNNTGKMILNAGSTYYILGDLNLNSGLISITGDNSKTTNIYINGSFTANNSSTLTSNGKLLVYVSSNLNVNGSPTIGGSYYVNGDAVFWNTSVLTGVISAKSLTLGGSSRINYAADTTQNTPTNNINHYEIRYPASQVTCEPAVVTINACTNNDASSCILDKTPTATVTLSALASSGFTNPITLTNGTTTIALNHYAVGNVTLGLSNSTTFSCFKNGALDTTCQLPFVSSAFSFNIPTFYAGRSSGNVAFKALQASVTNPAACTSLFAGKTQSINFTNQFVLPSTAGSDTPKLNNVAITTNTPVPLTFDNSGVANIALTYNDAGVLGISAAYSTADTTAGTLNIAGSDHVAVLPDSIQLTAVGQTACKVTTDTATTDEKDKAYAACSKYKKAGETFTLSAQAGYFSGSTLKATNNFTPQSTVVKPILQHQLLAPSTGTLSSSWASTALAFLSGSASSVVSEGDVGVYQYRVMAYDGKNGFVPYPSYQDEATPLTVPESVVNWSAPVGRIIPAQLKATLVANGSLTTDTCVAANQTSSTLGYTGQVLRFASIPMLSVTALGSDGSTVMKNYQGVFAKVTDMKVPGSAKFVAAMIPKNNANTLTSIANWFDGTWTTPGNAYTHIYTFSANNQFTFSKTSTPVIPFETSLEVSTLTDSDDVIATSYLPLTFNPVAPDASEFKVYSGRLTLDSVNGAEDNGFALPFYMQYWNGSAYAINSADNCTSLASNTLQMNNQTNWTGIPLQVASATNSVATTTASLSQAKVSSGVGFISFTAPNASGWVDIAATSSLPDWMKDYTLPSGLTPARASFGYYRGNDRLIYRREVFGGQ